MSDKRQKIRIKLKSYDYRLIDDAASLISSVASESGAIISGPVPLPTHVQPYCVIRSPHIDKISREHFKLSEHKRVMKLLCSSGTVDALMTLNLPAGVSVEVKYMTA